jgi:hypothetical protein
VEEQQPHPTGKNYSMGDIGPYARVAQGENISWTEGSARDPDGEELKRQFADLLKRIDNAPDLDEDERALAKEKTEVVAESLANARRDPGRLRRALLDAKGFLTSSAHSVWDQLNQILISEAAQKTIGTITEASIKAAIQSLLGIP